MWPFTRKNQGPSGKKGSVIDSLSLLQYFGWGGASWTKKSFRKFSQEAFLRNVIAYRCIDIRSKAFQSVPWELYRRTSDGRILIDQQANISQFLRRPNPRESWGTIMYKSEAFINIGGNAYFLKTAPETGPNSGIVRELFSLMPERVKPIIKDGILVAYEYKRRDGEKVTYFVDPITGECEILHIRLFNPLDDYDGTPPTQPTQREVDISNQATEWNMRMMQNEGRPGMVITAEGQLTTEQRDEIKNVVNTMYAGASNAGRTLILDGTNNIKAAPYSWSPKDMDWIESHKDTARRICFGYGVPPQLVGIPDTMTFSNYKEARQAFWEDTVIPELDLFASNLNHYLFPKKGNDLFLAYNVDDVPAMALKREKIWEMANSSDDLTINERREMKGFEEIEGGDVIMVPVSSIPLGSDFGNDESQTDAEKRIIGNFVSQGYTEEEAHSLADLPMLGK